MKIERYEDIMAWQKARVLANKVYEAAKNDALFRDCGLIDQITRALSSLMHHFAEGFDGASNAEFVRFLKYAPGYASELPSQCDEALDQTHISDANFRNSTPRLKKPSSLSVASSLT